MRLLVVSLLLASGLLLTVPAAAGPEDELLDAGAADAAAVADPDDAGTDASSKHVDAGTRPLPPADGEEEPSSSSSSSGNTRPSPPISLPSDYDHRNDQGYVASSPAPVAYYEGESCSGGDSYYDDGSSGCSGDTYDSTGGGGTVVYTGDDDDDDADDDDDDTAAPPTATGADDDDDADDDDSVDIEWGDDDDDDGDTTASYVAPHEKTTKVAHVNAPPPRRRSSSPVSRLAILGVLLAFPLRRRGTLAGHARRRNGS